MSEEKHTSIDFQKLEPWQKAFYELNMKIGNEAWGAQLVNEGDGDFIVIYVSDPNFKEKVQKELNGKLDGKDIQFKVMPQPPRN